MNSFLHALHTRIDTKDATIREELYSLKEQLRRRKIKTKQELTTDCLARINESREFGVVGYRLLEKELFVFEDGPVKMEAEKKMQLENYIEKVFNGKVKIIPLREILKPHCAFECGSFITNSATNKSATIGIFGNMQNLVRNGEEKTVALSSPNLFSEGDHASLPNGENIGVCLWPVKPESQVENLRDVSIIEIDSSWLDRVKRTIFDKHIRVEEIPNRDLDYKQVFKYGAKTETTYGWIKKISNFQLFESDVLVILPKSPAKSFSEEGDSGAIVMTKIKGNCYGVGMVYGSHFDVENTTNNNAQIATIGIFLKNALERFTGRRNMSIKFDKI